MPKNIDPERRNQVARLYQDGNSLDEVAKLTGLSQWSVWNDLKQVGVVSRPAHRRPITTEKLHNRFWARVNRQAATECWGWTGSVSPEGYGRYSLWYAHRLSWEIHNGKEVPASTEIDHLCRNRLCVNPGHLEPVPHRENVYRGTSPLAHNKIKSHCKWGHEFSTENTIYRVTKYGTHRGCRECYRRRDRERSPRREQPLGVRDGR